MHSLPSSTIRRIYLLAILILPFQCLGQWVEMNGQGINQPYNNLPGNGGITLSSGNSVYYVTGSTNFQVANNIYNCNFFRYDLITGLWHTEPQLSNFCGSRSGATAFSYGGKSFTGFGNNDFNTFDDFYELDIQTGVITQKASLPSPVNHAISFVSNNKAYVGGGWYSNVAQLAMYSYDFSTNSWQTVTPLPSSIINTGNIFVMEIDDNGYMLAYRDTLGNAVRTWSKYDANLMSWIPMAPYPGSSINGVCGFSLSDQGFIGFGIDTLHETLPEFYQYDALNDLWIQKNQYDKIEPYSLSFSNGIKSGIIGNNGNTFEYDVVNDNWTEKVGKPLYVSGGKMIVINNKAYGKQATYDIANDFWTKDSLLDMDWVFQLYDVGYGFSNNVFSMFSPSLPVIPFQPAPAPPSGVNTFFSIGNKGYAGDFKNDPTSGFWEFDPLTQQWTRKADFPGPKRECQGGFSIGNKGYITGGWCDDIGFYIYDFWEYNPANDTWTRKADGPTGFLGSFREGNNTKGFVGCGIWDAVGSDNGDVSMYDPQTDAWTPIAGLTPRHSIYSFMANGSLYVGGGITRYSQLDGIIHYDLFRYDYNVGVEEINSKTSVETYPNPSNGIFYIKNLMPESRIEIFDSDGRKLFSAISETTTLTLDVKGILAPGIYFLRNKKESKSATRKFVITE